MRGMQLHLLLTLGLLFGLGAAGKPRHRRALAGTRQIYEPTLQACSNSANLVQNPGFEDEKFYPWFKTNPYATARRQTDHAYGGRFSVLLTACPHTVGAIAQTFLLHAGSSYRLTIQARAKSGLPPTRPATLQVLAGGALILQNTTLTDTYTTYTSIFYAQLRAPDTTRLELRFTGSVVMDEVKLVCQVPLLGVDPTERTATLSTYFTAGGVLMDTIPVFVTPFNQGQVVLDDTMVDVETGAALLTTQCTTNTVHSSFRKQAVYTPSPVAMFRLLSTAGTGATRLQVNPQLGSFSLGTYNATYDQFAQDFRIQATCSTPNSGTKLVIFTLTILPRQGETGSSAQDNAPFPLLCTPGVGELANVGNIMPRQVPCSSVNKTNRGVLESQTFAGLHPEESEWVSQRNIKTSASLRAYVMAELGPSALPSEPDATNLKVAITNSGGGKRAFFNSVGVTSGLHKLGVYDHATWHGGLSGGAWFVSFYLNQLIRGQALNSTPAELYQSSGVDQRAPQAVFDEWMKGNQILFYRPFTSVQNQPDVSRITCEGALKLNAPAIQGDEVWASSAFMEAYSRSIASQVLFDQGTEDSPLFSDVPLKEPYASHSSPLPLMQLSEAVEFGYDPTEHRIVEVTPFDLAINDPNGSFGLSYPTALFGTDPLDEKDGVCTINQDLLSNLFGISSYAFTGLANGEAFRVAGAEGLCLRSNTNSNPDIANDPCGPVPIRNAFFESPLVPNTTAPELLNNRVLYLTDGGTTLNLPVYPFLTPTRKADVIFAVDSSAGDTAPPPYSAENGRFTLFSCPVCPLSDYENNCPAVASFLSATYLSTNSDDSDCDTQCCNVCGGPGAYANGCWPSNDPATNEIYNVARYYPAGMPTLPTASFSTNGISFLGCDQLDDPSVSAVVYIPLTLLTSGKGGFSTETGVFQATDLPVNFLTPEIVADIVASGEASFPADFSTCLACLYAGKMNKNNAYLGLSPPLAQCAQCRAAYCA